MIFYYTNSNRTNHKGTILLEDAKITSIDTGFTPHSIQIETPSRVYLISCDTVEERNDWVSTIRLLRASSCAAVVFLRSFSFCNFNLIEKKKGTFSVGYY